MNTIETRSPQARGSAGFTLIEILIAVAIIGILVAIAIPGYTAFVEKSRRTDATAWLSQAAGEQVRFFSEENSYADSLTDLGYDNADTENGHYTITLVRDNPTSFLLTATATGIQAEDEDCASLTISSTGAKTAMTRAGADNPDCW